MSVIQSGNWLQYVWNDFLTATCVNLKKNGKTKNILRKPGGAIFLWRFLWSFITVASYDNRPPLFMTEFIDEIWRFLWSFLWKLHFQAFVKFCLEKVFIFETKPGSKDCLVSLFLKPDPFMFWDCIFSQKKTNYYCRYHRMENMFFMKQKETPPACFLKYSQGAKINSQTGYEW